MYNANIPQAGDDQDVSQPQILANFTALASFGNGYASLALQGGAPTLNGNGGLYIVAGSTSVTVGTAATNETFIHKPSNDAPTDIPMTASIMSATAMASCTNGWSYLPSGLLIKWGQVPLTSSATYTGVTPASVSGGPAYVQTFQVYVTPGTSDATPTSFVAMYKSGSLNTTTAAFDVVGFGATANTVVNYLVIGV